MCRSIKPLFNFDPPATDQEIYEASRQFVRKLSGFTTPSQTNEVAFNHAIEHISLAARDLLDSLTTTARTHTREEVAAKARARSLKRFGGQPDGA